MHNPIRYVALCGLFCLAVLGLASCGRAATVAPTPAPVQRTVTINADVDGTRVDPVRVWASPTERTQLVAQLHHGDRVGLVRVEGDAALVRTPSGDGWLLTGFIDELR